MNPRSLGVGTCRRADGAHRRRNHRAGATLSYGRLYRDALAVASSLTDGVLQLQPAPLSASNPAVNRGAIISPVVLLHLPNCLPFATLAYGVLASGLTLTAANPVLTPAEVAHILSLSQPSVIVTTEAGLASFQAAFKLLTPELQNKLAYPTSGSVFLVDLEADDYGVAAESLAKVPSSIDGWSVRDWKVLVPAKPKSFTPPKYVGSEDALRAAMIVSTPFAPCSFLRSRILSRFFFSSLPLPPNSPHTP